ncbi:hypothetical protein JCM10207_005443 [Rhodosporidiobolus poonsookiae]
MLASGLLLAVLAVSTVTAEPSLSSAQLVKGIPHPLPRLFRHLNEREQAAFEQPADASHSQQITFSASTGRSKPAYEAHWFDQLVSHDAEVPAPSANATFGQRYWFDATYYKPGGPVILLDGGETDGAGRLPFLESGILKILSEATGGIGVVFEHRYYGQSFPVQNLTTDSYRYLTTLQSLHDGAHFAQTIKFPGLEDHNLTSSDAPWLYYGGSYAGAKAAFARKLFPDVFWGAIASSAVTTAVVDYWQYYEPIRQNGPELCISRLINHTALIDSLLSLKSPLVTSSLKSFFGLGNVTSDADFVNALTIPLGSWQARNWDDKVGSSFFHAFCDAIEQDAPSSPIAVPVALQTAALPHWPTNPRARFAAFSTYAAFIKERVASSCPAELTQDECFGTEVGGDSLDEAPWKSWSYQVCTEWGYWIGAPPGKDHPSLVSRLLTPEYTSGVCKAFPPGELNRVPSSPNVTAINQYGSYSLTYPRLAFIDGSADPWLYATPHSPEATTRKDTLKRPFKLIPGGVHHWDENGLLPPAAEPSAIARVHADEIAFVQAWLREWRDRGRWRWKGGQLDRERDEVVGRWDRVLWRK